MFILVRSVGKWSVPVAPTLAPSGYVVSVTERPQADRPFMPGYGIRPASEGTGLLPWAWAVERLFASHDYWLATRRPDGHPHLMPVWAVWLDEALWFSCSNSSRKTRNLRADPRCSLATSNALQPVVAEGTAEVVSDQAELRRLLAAENAKYETSYGLEMLDPAANTCFRVRPIWVFALDEADFTGSPTRFRFGQSPG
jgi:PPOX class probable F420-dependent enzyme